MLDFASIWVWDKVPKGYLNIEQHDISRRRIGAPAMGTVGMSAYFFFLRMGRPVSEFSDTS